MTPAALPAMLRCAFPRPAVGDVSITHAGTFSAGPAWTPAPAPQKRGRPHTPSLGLPGSALPSSQAPVAPERKPLSLVSRNGIPLPLRAMPWRDLNREVWSHGKVVKADSLERSRARDLVAHEKEPCAMTLAELVATAKREPLSESRRSWLERGAGVMSLEGLEYGEGSIGETLAASIDLETLVETVADLDLEEEHDAVRFGTPIELLDPITAKQIAWEQEQHGVSEVVRARLVASSNGGITIQTDRKLLPEPLMRLAKSVKRTMATAFGPVATMDDLHARVDLILDAQAESGVTRDFGSPDPDEERARLNEPAPLEWHTSYERVQDVVAMISDEWAQRPCRRCARPEQHRHERIARLIHRRPVHANADEFWRQRIFDPSAFELGTDGLVSPLVVEPFTTLYPLDYPVQG